MRHPECQEQQARRRQCQAAGWKQGGTSGPCHQLAGDQRPDPDPEGERQQQKSGFRRRGAADRAQIDRYESDQRDQRCAMTGRHRVAPPHRRLPEEERRNERRGAELLLPKQKNERKQAERQEAERDRQRAHVHLLNLLQSEDHRGHEHREQHQTRRIERGPPTVARQHPETQHQQSGKEPERQVDEEDRLPSKSLGQVTAGDRAEGVGADRHAGEVALIAAALARRECFADQRLRQRHQSAAAKALQHARRGQELDVGGERAQERADHEQGQRGEHHAPPAKESPSRP